MYEEDKDKVKQVIGVHFQSNANVNAADTVGIEIKVVKKNNMTYILSSSTARYRLLEYDTTSNFAKCEPFNDIQTVPKNSDVKIDPKHIKDLLASELFELKNLWFAYNKKINTLLMILPQDVVNRYDMVVKSLSPPQFENNKFSNVDYEDVFDEAVFKMAQFYFAVF